MRDLSGAGWLGIDLGGTKVACLVVDDEAKPLARIVRPTGRDVTPDVVLDRVLAAAREAIDAAGVTVAAAGVGFPGLVDADAGRVLSSVILPGWDGFHLTQRLEEELGVPSALDNDATAAGIGEYFALGEPEGLHLVALTVGTGIGGAIVIDGELFRGRLGTSAEFGHMTVDWNGEECWCGNVGCLHTLASGSGIGTQAARLAAELGGELKGEAVPIPVQRVAEAAERGDEAARRALDIGARGLGAGIANIVNVFNPDRVALSGGVVELGDAYLDVVREEAAKRAFDEPMGCVTIERARFGLDTGAVGAAALGRRRVRAGAAG